MRAEQYLAAALREGHDWREALPPLLRVCLTGSRLRAGLNYASPYLRSHPDELWLRYLVATVHLGLGQPLRAREHLQAIRGKAPYEARTEYLLGQTEWEGLGDGSAAAAHFHEYLRLEPGGAHAREVSEWLQLRASAAQPRGVSSGASSEAAGAESASVIERLPAAVAAPAAAVVPARVAPAVVVVPAASEATP